LTLLAGAALIALGAAGIPLTGGLSGIGIAGGAALITASIGLFVSGRRTGLAKAMHDIQAAGHREVKKLRA
jgi:hypothetical protein